MTQKEKSEQLKQSYSNRKFIKLTMRNAERLKKGKRIYVLCDGIGYDIRASAIPELYDANGKKLGKAAIKKLIRSIR